MYINFKQHWVSTSVKTVHTNLYAKIRKLHKFATSSQLPIVILIKNNIHHRIMTMKIVYFDT